MTLLKMQDIPFCQMYGTDTEWSARYGEDGGVKLIKAFSVLGLDFRAAIVCGLPPLGEHDGTKNPDWMSIRENEETFLLKLQKTKDNVRTLYVSCTRAKEVLHIILPESGETSVYAKMLEAAE
jgi:superfamily I DNA/RNA helicase